MLPPGVALFLSSLARDFIKDSTWTWNPTAASAFLSSLAQDFIEENPKSFMGSSPPDS